MIWKRWSFFFFPERARIAHLGWLGRLPRRGHWSDWSWACSQFCFQNVKYMQLQIESFTIRNGQVPCQFEFINKPDEESYCKQWLSANPSRGFLLPGKASVPRFLVAGLGNTLPYLCSFSWNKLFVSECFVVCLNIFQSPVDEPSINKI